MTGNFLLDALSPEDLRALQDQMVAVEFKMGDVVYEAGAEVEHVVFPLEGLLLSIISIMLDGSQVETSAVGRESAVGFMEACGGRVSHSLVVCQMQGRALRAPAAAYAKAFDGSASLRAVVAQHVELLLTEARQEVACSGMHSADARLARWFLACRDKTGRDQLNMTQEFLAAMVGSQRTTVSAVAADFKAAGLISYSRGELKVLDPESLERRACECYRTMKHFRQMMGQPGS